MRSMNSSGWAQLVADGLKQLVIRSRREDVGRQAPHLGKAPLYDSTFDWASTTRMPSRVSSRSVSSIAC